MPASLDCILCLTRQSLDAARFATEDTSVHAKVLRRALELALDRGFTENPPYWGQEIQREIRRLTGIADPYYGVKRKFNRLMISRSDALRAKIRSASRPMDAAVRIAIAGNTIDFALGAHLTPESVDAAIEQALFQPINGNVERFFEVVSQSRNILYLADNSGEIVCDGLLIEEIQRQYPETNITLAVRGIPVLNDAVREDAEEAGLTERVPVIDNGNDGLGTILEQCSEEFLAHFRAADLIIAKGLANYETLVEYGPDRMPPHVAYLFKAKCRFIAEFSGTRLGDLVVKVSDRE